MTDVPVVIIRQYCLFYLYPWAASSRFASCPKQDRRAWLDHHQVARIETVDELRRRIDEAARYLALEQLAISPQCRFASSLRGNLLSEEEQFRKLDVMLETARKVWGVP